LAADFTGFIGLSPGGGFCHSAGILFLWWPANFHDFRPENGLELPVPDRIVSATEAQGKRIVAPGLKQKDERIGPC
jgi:hypothetical protein